jgi:hypothetical protein
MWIFLEQLINNFPLRYHVSLVSIVLVVQWVLELLAVTCPDHMLSSISCQMGFMVANGVKVLIVCVV